MVPQRLARRLLLPALDAGLVGPGLLLVHRVGVGTWVPSSAGGAAIALLTSALYLAALAAAGRYSADPSARSEAREAAAGGAVALLAGATTLLAPSLLSPAVATGHGAGALVALLGGGRLRHRLEASADAPDPAAPSSPPPGLALDDLVPRAPVRLDRPGLRRALSGRTVLVTGAGGSIGAELSRQLTALSPARLLLVDVSESHLHQLETTLRAQAPSVDLSFVLADLRDGSRIGGLLAREEPDVVLHTSAYKHVPLMERYPAEAARNNTLATAQLLQLCENNGVEQFVFVSTDKAVAPENVLGATKRWAEWYVRTAQPPVQARTVRFGNVFGSDGSVVPRFREHLAAGTPLPVTHPDMERYFMTAEEACQLLLQTLLFTGRPTYLLKMGDPVSIQWLAEEFVRRWYPERAPQDMIEYVGPRPGEKLSEQLVAPGESVHDTEHPSIVGLDGPQPYGRDTLDRHLQAIAAACDASDDDGERVRRLLFQTELAPAPALASSRS
jgi:FlaA1/EpsC-like NDP-sugar epimerase